MAVLPCAVVLVTTVSAVVLNEILYDPAGPDGDSEYVELFNPGDRPVPLDGMELWFLNGGDSAAAKRVWSARAGTRIAAGGFRVIGEEAVAAADETTRLGLQNGPDAVELRRNGDRVDAVAWGAEAAAGGEGEAVPDAAGQPIGRVPDGNDTGDNARDLRALPRATPGGPNLPAVWFDPAGADWDPAWRADPGPMHWSVRWIARGWADIQEGVLRADRAERSVRADRGDTVVVEVTLSLDAGPHARTIEAVASHPAFAVDDTSRVWVGPASVRLAEVQARPDSGEPEWVELVADEPADLSDWRLADQGRPRRIGGDPVTAAGERLVLTADPAALVRVHAVDPAVVVLRPEDGWPTLNDGRAGDRAPADEVRLLDPRGRVVDRVVYARTDLGARGESLQRTSVIAGGRVRWMRAAGPPTPGRPHPLELFRPDDPVLTVGPDPFSPDGDGRDDLLQIVLETPGQEPLAEIRDLWGAPVVVLRGAVGPGRAHWQWDGTDADGRPVPVGAYVVYVRAEATRGAERAWRRIVGLGRR